MRRGRSREVAKQLVLETPDVLCPFEMIEGAFDPQLPWVLLRLELLLLAFLVAGAQFGL